MRISSEAGGAGTGRPKVGLVEASVGGVSSCLWLLRLLRCGRGLSCGCAVALRKDEKKLWKGPAFATSAELIRMAIDNQTTIAGSDRFTGTVSHQSVGLRVLGLIISINSV